MIIGVTATRGEVTAAQVMGAALRARELGATELHHGDCVGGDKAMHDALRPWVSKIIIHPPLNPRYRAHCDGDEVLLEFPYLVRNEHIVRAIEYLFVLPSGPEVLRSGTWSTKRCAERLGVSFEVWMPDGTTHRGGR